LRHISYEDITSNFPQKLDSLKDMFPFFGSLVTKAKGFGKYPKEGISSAY